MSTINIVGTGGIIEGDLDAANVNVNLDSALSFDGTDDYINVGDNNSLDLGTGDFTFSAWIKLNALGDYNMIFDKGSGASRYSFLVWGDNRLAIHIEASFISSLTITDTEWHFVGVSCDRSGNATFNLDGKTDTVDISSKSSNDLTNTDDLRIGVRFDLGDHWFNGILADARIYNTALSEPNMRVLTSKINSDSSLGAGTTNLKGWWKLDGTESSGSGNVPDNSPQSNTGTLTGTSKDYDAFSVDVQDNSTTTDGTFTVTQGKVEGKALSSLTLDGTGDYVNTGWEFDTEMSQAFTWSGWFKPTDGQPAAQEYLMGLEKDSNNNWDIALETDGQIKANYKAGGTAVASTTTTALANGQEGWHHFVWVISTTSNDLYLNGVLETSTSHSITLSNYVNSDKELFFGDRNHSSSNPFTGNLRDLRLYGHALSADQAASLYSGSYNVTPTNMWKMDEGTGSTANDTGTGTARDITSFSGNAALGDNNGTLDLDGNFKIDDNGVFSAPRGTVTMEAASAFVFENESTVSVGTNASGVAITGFIHNNGTVDVDGSTGSNPVILEADNVATTTFYNLTISNDHQIRTFQSLTVENNYTLADATYGHIFDPDTLGSKLTLTMGTPTDGGIMTLSGEKFRSTNDSQTFAVVGASDLDYTQVNTNPFDFDFDDNGTWELKNLNFNSDITTSGAGLTLKLMGDCEFNAVTVSDGDTLDLNGQRMECSGQFTRLGTVSDTGGGGLFISATGYNSNASTVLTSTNAIMTGTGTNDIDAFGTTMFNFGTGSDAIYNWSKNGLYSSNILVGSGTINSDTNNIDQECNNLTIATGGTLEAGDQTITVAGDFTTSGGLLGASCLELNGSDEYGYNSGTTWGFGDAWTIEFWFKTGTDALMYLVDLYNGTNNNNRIYLRLRDDSTLKFGTYDSGGTEHGLHVTGIDGDDGKWHHVALTSSGTVKQCYYDGKLQAQSTTTVDRDSDPTMRLLLGKLNGGSNYWNGQIEEFRIFSDVRTEAEIRADMFSSGTLANSGNLVARYSFDEGSGSAVDNLETTAARDLVTYDGSGAATDLWAGAGTFTRGTSTVNMTGASGKLHLGSAGYEFNNLGVAPSGGTTTLTKVGGHSNIRVYGTLTHNSGTFAQSGNMAIEILGSGTVSAGATLPYICYWGSSTNVPTANFQYFIANETTVTFAGACNFTGYWRTGANEIVGGAFSHSLRTLVIDSGGTADLRNTTLTFTGTTSSTSFDESSLNSTILSGNTTIIGHISGSNKTNWKSVAGLNHEIVGNVSNLDFLAGNDLTIIGSITNCTGEGFRQWHHTLDTQQLLDADEDGDDDLRLTKPALDNALELMTK